MQLKSVIELKTGGYYAKWFDDDGAGLGFTVGALHHADGRLDAANGRAKPPRLTPEQMAEAQPEQTPAEALAAKGVARRPDWAKRYQKAARLVDAGAVRLVDPDLAIVTGDTAAYEIGRGQKCGCKWTEYNADPCSHYLAMRIARGLNQALELWTEAEKEARGEARALANRRAEKLRIANRGPNIFEERRRARRSNAEGARLWINAAMANGRKTIPADILERAAYAKASHGGD